MLKRIFIALFLFPFIVVPAQHRAVNIDSIKQLVRISSDDSSRMNNMLYLTYLQEAVVPKEALAYADTVRMLAPGIPFEEAYLKTYYLKAKVYNRQGMIDAARDEILEVIDEPNLSLYPDVACDCYRLMGENFYYRYQYESAINYYLKSLEIGQAIGDFGCHGGSLYNLGSIYLDMGNLSIALEYYYQALDVMLESGRPNMIAYAYRGIAEATDDTGTARASLDSALVYARLSENPNEVRYTLIDYARLEQKIGRHDVAVDRFRAAMEIELDRGDNLLDAMIHMEYAALLLESQLPAEASVHYDRSRDIVRIAGKEPSEARYFYDHARYNELAGKDREAAALYKAYIALEDSVFDRTLAGFVADKNARFRIAESQEKIRDQEVRLSRQTTLRQRLLVGGAVLILLLLLLFQYIYQNQKRKKQTAEYELELQRTEMESLRQLDTLKTRFFANISHELRTPLTLILGPLEQAVGKVNGKPVRDDLETALRNGNRLHELINSILDFSKIEQGELGVRKSSVEATAFFRRIVSSFESVAHMNLIDLGFRSGLSDGTYILLDRDKVEKILVNLMGNAFKFTPLRGEITVTVGHTADRLVIEVSDNGAGIPADDLPHIFERFYQSRHQDRIQQGGTGIGLALSRDLARLMGGDITAESVLEQGSTFRVRLPYERTSAPTEGSPEEPETNGELPVEEIRFEPLFVRGNKPRILIVDDNNEMRTYIHRLLERDYDCTEARDGLAAFELLKTYTFDLVTCDVMMPHMDGFELREKLNATGISGQVPFIMVTARALEEDIVRGLRLGVDDYITKPFNARELQARVYNLVQNRIERDSQTDEDQAEFTAAAGTSVSTRLLTEIEAVVLEHISDSGLKVDDLAGKLNYSRRQLGRLVKKEVGLTLVGYVLEIRLQRARMLLEKQACRSVKEVQFAVGIESASYFTRKFYERFGKRPNEYLS